MNVQYNKTRQEDAIMQIDYSSLLIDETELIVSYNRVEFIVVQT